MIYIVKIKEGYDRHEFKFDDGVKALQFAEDARTHIVSDNIDIIEVTLKVIIPVKEEAIYVDTDSVKVIKNDAE